VKDDLPQAPIDEEPAVRPSFVTSYAPLVAIVVAVLAVTAAAYVAMRGERAEVKRPAPDPPAPARPQQVDARFDLRYPPELGPFGQTWQWMGSSGGVLTRGSGTYHLAFRALSLQGERRLTVGGAGTVTVDVLPRTYIVGPLRLGPMGLRLQAQPGARRVSRRDTRRVSVFLSGARLAPEPVAALPGKGFYPDERLADGTPFQWLRDRGVVDLVSRDRLRRRAWVRLRLVSPVDRQITASVVGARSAGPLRLPRNTRTTLAVGPVPLREGRGRFRLRLAPGPRSVKGDRRPLGAQVLSVSASLWPPPP